MRWISEVSFGTTIRSSSIRTTPLRPGPFSGTKGSTCFCPVSAMAANQELVWSRSMNARIVGFSALLAFL